MKVVVAHQADGTPRKVLDVSKLNALGWSPRYDLDTGIRSTYDWFLAQGASDGEPRGMPGTGAAA